MGEYSKSEGAPFFVFDNPDRFKMTVPDGYSDVDGPCFRRALDEAGVYTNLPRWIDSQFIADICAELHLTLHNKGKVWLQNGKKYIVGYIMRGDDGVEIGHFEFTRRIGDVLKKIDEKDLLGVIEV